MSTAMEKCSKKDILSNTTPLKFLTTEGLDQLSTACTVQHLSKHDHLYTVDDYLDKSAFVLCTGSINITDDAGHFIALVNHSFTFFDESFVIFDEERHRNAFAKSESTVLTIPAAAIERILEDPNEMRFSQALGTRLRLSQGIASSLSEFEFALRAALLSGCVDIRKIIPAYKKLAPAIHRGASLSTLDIVAWGYAVNRLPQFINEVRHLSIIQSFVLSLSQIYTCERKMYIS
jgi:hypothetical protein